jgi:hypothetical protein
MTSASSMVVGIQPAAKFGKLEPVELRACWADEAKNFTPWLASPEAIAMLGETLDLELAIEGVEVPVGPYSADILARDLTTNALVVIENQLERTNHDHFGKVLTYAAILGATTVIWIAKAFTEEHRKAVEWLNELTEGDLSLYGIELQVWRIGTSEPAPRFEVVCGPNEIVREAKKAADDSAPFSETRTLQLEFWKAVRSSLEQSGRFSSLQSPRPRYWFDIAIGRAHIHLSLIANTESKRVGVRLYLNARVADRALEQLALARQQIEQEIGSPLEWNPHPDNQDKIIRLMRPGDLGDRGSWPDLVKWISGTAIAFKDAFGPRIAQLDLSAMEYQGVPST